MDKLFKIKIKEAKNMSLKVEKFVEDNFSLSNYIKEEIE